MLIETLMAFAIQFSGSPIEYRWNESKAAIESFDCESNQQCHGMKSLLFRVDEAETINQMVNGFMTYKAETLENWNEPETIFETLEGDCEEFAIMKLVLLKELGFDMSKAFIHIMVDVNNPDYWHMTVSYEGEYLDYMDDLEQRFINVMLINYEKPGLYLIGKEA